MSDRRPENPRPLFAGCPTHPEHADRKHDYMGNVSNYGDPCSFQLEPASPADLIAAVRWGVESGTIKGRELDWLDPDNEGQFRRVLVIPVSDGGSET